MVAMNYEVIGSSRPGLLAKNHDNPILFFFLQFWSRHIKQFRQPPVYMVAMKYEVIGRSRLGLLPACLLRTTMTSKFSFRILHHKMQFHSKFPFQETSRRITQPKIQIITKVFLSCLQLTLSINLLSF
jgi:hypothetical protein